MQNHTPSEELIHAIIATTEDRQHLLDALDEIPQQCRNAMYSALLQIAKSVNVIEDPNMDTQGQNPNTVSITMTEEIQAVIDELDLEADEDDDTIALARGIEGCRNFIRLAHPRRITDAHGFRNREIGSVADTNGPTSERGRLANALINAVEQGVDFSTIFREIPEEHQAPFFAILLYALLVDIAAGEKDKERLAKMPDQAEVIVFPKERIWQEP